MFCLFCILGITEFIHGLKLKLLAVERSQNNANLIVLNDDTALGQLSFAYSQMRWSGNDFCNVIIAVTDNLSKETLELCRAYSKKRRIVLIPSEYLKNVLNCVF